MTVVRAARQAGWLLVTHPTRFTLMARAALHVTVAAAAMRVASLPRAVAFSSDGRPGPGRVSPDEIETAVDAVLSARVLWLRPNCWRRSLAIRRLLRANGDEVSIVFGIRGGAQGVAGHAWLEKNGVAVGAPGIDPRFIPYFRHPPMPESSDLP